MNLDAQLETACEAYWNAGWGVEHRKIRRWDEIDEDQREIVRPRIRAALAALSPSVGREAFEGMLAALKRIANEVHAPGRFAASMPHDMREQARAAIAKAEAATLEPNPQGERVRVRELEWRENGFAHTATGVFYHVRYDQLHQLWLLSAYEGNSTTNSAYDTEETAKAFAQSDFNHRILSALALPIPPLQETGE